MHVPRSAAASSRRPMFVARRRRRVRPLLIALAAVGLLVAWTSSDIGPLAATGDAPGQAAPGDATAPPVDAGEPDDEDTGTTPPLATTAGLRLSLPTERPLIVGFHEASSPEALEMDPRGRLVDNENTTKFEPPPEVDEGADYLVMSSRGRPRAATSAVDVVMDPGDPVRSPVTGTVTDVRSYHLYGSHEDHRIEIAPDENPDLRLVLIHLDEVEVALGDPVEAGRSVLAGTARAFPFGSQVDRYTEPERWPHVHLEVKAADDEAERDARS